MVHGTTCLVAAGELPFLSTAGVGNASTTESLGLDCTIPVSAQSRYTSLASVHASTGGLVGSCNDEDPSRRPWVEVYDRNADSDVTCNLFIQGIGNVILSTYTVHSSGAKGPAQKLVFPHQARRLPDGRERRRQGPAAPLRAVLGAGADHGHVLYRSLRFPNLLV